MTYTNHNREMKLSHAVNRIARYKVTEVFEALETTLSFGSIALTMTNSVATLHHIH